MAETHLFDKITIIGLGLIGSSIARATRTHRLARSITGCDRSEISLGYAQSSRIIDTSTQDLVPAVKDSQLVVLATPPGTFADITRAIAPALAEGAIVMDVASVKQAAVQSIAPHLPAHVDFIPAHPITGGEQSGVQAGRDDLFYRRHVILTPQAAKLTPALQKITSFWKGMGARVDAMPADLHDQIYAYVSHLPHLLSFACRSVLEERPQEPESDMLRRFLRISHSNRALWSEVFLLNKDNLIKALDRYLDVIAHIKHELGQAPEGEPAPEDSEKAYALLFPRLAASCLITTVMEAERPTGIPFVRYAGAGFEDFTFPASTPPDADIEQISNRHAVIGKMMGDYGDRLQLIRSSITAGNLDNLREVLVS